MPIWLRNFTFKSIQEHLDNMVKNSKKQNTPKNKQSFGPDIKPSFSSKSSKK